MWLDPDKLKTLHEHIRSGSEEAAVALYQDLGSMYAEAAREAIRRETEFLQVVDASRAIGPSASGRNLTPRQAVIWAALVGWYGDELTSWHSPITEDTLLAWAESHYMGPQKHLQVAFLGLLAQGLFFEIHPGVFAEPCYFCSYEEEFLNETPDARPHARSWTKWRRYHDQHCRGWQELGLCVGQGSQGGGSDAEIGICLGSSCCCFARDASEECTQELEYHPRLLAEYTARQPNYLR
jgi:hypothetical protein